MSTTNMKASNRKGAQEKDSMINLFIQHMQANEKFRDQNGGCLPPKHRQNRMYGISSLEVYSINASLSSTMIQMHIFNLQKSILQCNSRVEGPCVTQFYPPATFVQCFFWVKYSTEKLGFNIYSFTHYQTIFSHVLFFLLCLDIPPSSHSAKF